MHAYIAAVTMDDGGDARRGGRVRQLGRFRLPST